MEKQSAVVKPSKPARGSKTPAAKKVMEQSRTLPNVSSQDKSDRDGKTDNAPAKQSDGMGLDMFDDENVVDGLPDVRIRRASITT